MKTKNILCGLAIAVVLQLGVLAGSAQTNIYLYSGSETNITLSPGTYIITAYGAGGGGDGGGFNSGGGAEMIGEFHFSTSTNLTLLVGGGGGEGVGGSSGGGGGSFVVEGSTPLVIAGGGGGSSYHSDGGLGGTGSSGGDGTVTVTNGGFGGTDGGGGGGGVIGSDFDNSSGGGGGGGGGFYESGSSGGDGYDGYGNGGGGGGYSGGAGGYGFGAHGGYGGYGGGGGGGGFGIVGGYGAGGGGGGYSGGGGGGGCIQMGSFYYGGGGGGGSIIDSSAIAILAEVPGILSPDVPYYSRYNGEIIITVAPLAIITANAAFGFTNGAFGFDVTGPSGSNVVIEASTDLQTWIPLQANLLGSGPLYFSDPQWTNYPERFYRVTSAFTVGGTLTGLPAGATVTLQDNGGDTLTLSNNGTFTFPTALPDGYAYSVTVSRTSGGTLTTETTGAVTANGSGTISGANVTNVAVQSPLLYTGNLGLDMYNAALADGTAHGGVPAVMVTQYGGPFRLTAIGPYSYDIALIYQGSCQLAITVGNTSCSSTTFPSGALVIQFGTALACGQTFGYGY